MKTASKIQVRPSTGLWNSLGGEDIPIAASPSGVGVVAVSMPRDSVAVGIWTKVGGRYEEKRISGIAHFTEHMLFKGTKTRSARAIKESIEGLGGVFNAFTGEESTCYFVKILKEHFPLALEVLADMVKNSLFRKEDIERERTVILEEIKMYEDQPAQLVHERMNQLLWPNQSLGRFLAGTVKSITGLARKDFEEFFSQYYHPRNFLVSVCGDVNPEEVREAVTGHFQESSDRKVSQFPKAISRQDAPRFDLFRKKTEQTHLVMGLYSSSRQDPEKYKWALLNICLGGNMSSRLFEEVREKRGLAYEIKSHLNFFQDTGAFLISAGVEVKKLHTAMVVILKELRKMSVRTISGAELRRAKDYYLGQLYLALEDTLEYMLWLGEKALYLGKIPAREEIREAIEKITAEDIQDLARRYFKSEKLNLAVIGPIADQDEKKIRRDFH